jgi:hypothetical protein
LKGRYFSAARTLAQETASISNAPLGLEEQLQLIYKLHASNKSWLQRARRLLPRRTRHIFQPRSNAISLLRALCGG